MKPFYSFILTLVTLMPLSSYAQLWEQVGIEGPDGDVYSLFGDTVTNQLYIGGTFRVFDSVYVFGLGIWDGEQIFTIGDSLYCNGFCVEMVRDIVRYKDHLYFCYYGSPPFVNHDFNAICRWDGINWTNVDGNDLHMIESDGDIYSGAANLFSIIDDKLYVTGGFEYAGEQTATGIGIWDGINWEGLSIPGIEFTPILSGAAKWNGKYYFGGNILYNLDGEQYRDIIEYDGITWFPVGGGIHGGLPDIRDIVIFKDELYIAGGFHTSEGNDGDKIMKLYNGEWVKVGHIGPEGGAIADMEVWNDVLYVSGGFEYMGDVWSPNIAKWDGVKWCSFGSTFNKSILAIEVWNNELYIGGGFEVINGDSIEGIAKWIGGDYVYACGEPVAASSPPPVEKNLLRLYPNPISTNLLTAEYPDWPDESVSVSVVNSMGIPVHRQVVNMTGGKALITLPESLPPGYYTVSLWCERRGEGVVQRLVRL